MVRPEPLTEFSETFASMGFAQTAFTPSYGLAETTLAATFSPRGQGLKKHTIDMGRYERTSEAIEATELTPAEQQRTFVACGPALPEHEIEIRDFDGKILGEKMVGQVCLRVPLHLAVRVMKSRLCFCWNAAHATRNCLTKFTAP